MASAKRAISTENREAGRVEMTNLHSHARLLERRLSHEDWTAGEIDEAIERVAESLKTIKRYVTR